MPTLTRVDPVRDPVEFKLEDGTVYCTEIDPTTSKHFVKCHVCGETIRLTVTGNPKALYSHLEGRKCAAFRKKALQSSPGTTISQPRETSEPQTLPAQSNSVQYLCPGVPIKWTAGSIWTTYAYHLHVGDAIPWYPIGFNHDENVIFLRDIKCVKWRAVNSSSPCHRCMMLPSSQIFKSFESRAHALRDFTPWLYFTQEQLVQHLEVMNKKCANIRSELQQAKFRVVRTADRIDEYKRIVMLIASNEIAGLRRLLAASLRRGCSARSLIDLLHRAIKGLYSPKGGFNKRELDLGLLVKSLGGPKLLYAMNHSYGLPSESTVRRHHIIPRLLPSVSVPTKEEISHNIRAFFAPEVKPFLPAYPNGIPGVVGAFDGVAINCKARYCLERGVILGLCREHAHRIDTFVSGLETIDEAHEALFGDASKSPDTSVHFGSDATVVAVGPYARDDYYTMVPVIVSPSDKTEKAPDLVKWMQTFIDTWKDHEYGEKVSGPLWALASDGDSTFRRARHILCLAQRVDERSALGIRLSPLQGLNLYTSKEGITGTCDPKHIFKRFATLLRNTSGLLVFGTNITPGHTIEELSLLPGLTHDSARELLDPADKQNVPKAVALIQRLSLLETLPKPTDAFAANRRDILIFLSTFFMTFLRPFIDINMSLSEQVESLSTFAHLAVVLWIEHGSSCLTGALYADCQAVIKNIVFTIARCQNIDPGLLFHIIKEGSDRLEKLFGNTRTQDHDRNFDIRQLAEKLAIAAVIDATFERNPDLDRGHRRLSLDGAIGIDHVNPRSWKGDVRVGSVDLALSWKNGLTCANAILARFFGANRVQDFSKIFKTPNHDLLRPNGDVYVGSKPDDSDRRSEQINAPTSDSSNPTQPNPSERKESSESTHPDDRQPSTPEQNVTTQPQQQAPLAELSVNDVEDESDSDSEDESNFYGGLDDDPVEEDDAELAAAMSEAEDDEEDTEICDNASDNVTDADDVLVDGEFDDAPDEITIEDYMPDTSDEIQSMLEGSTEPEPRQQSPAVLRTLVIDGKHVSIDSLVSRLSPKHWRRVTMRTLRAQGRVIEDFSKSKFSSSGFFEGESDVQNNTLMKATDLATLLVRSGDTICLAVMEITSFRFNNGNEKSLRTTAKYSDLADKRLQIKVIGQLVDLQPSVELLDSDSGPEHWEWHRDYIQLNISSESNVKSRSQFVIEVPSVFVHAMNPSIALCHSSPNTGHRLVWAISRASLEEHLDEAWKHLRPAEDEILSNVQMLPSVNNPVALPYRDRAGNQWFYITKLPPNVVLGHKILPSQIVHCFICGAAKKLSQMRNHVGQHILWEMRLQKQQGEQDDELKNPVGAFPCGFCGLDGCFTQISERKRGSKVNRKIQSNCIYHYETMNFTSASKCSKSSPCTNIPIPCSLCPRSLSGDPHTIWKYSAILHLITEHPVVAWIDEDDENEVSREVLTLPEIPPDMLINMYISRTEEKRMGIKEAVTIAFRKVNKLPHSDGIQAMMDDLRDPDNNKSKRERAETVSNVYPTSKRKK